MRVFFFRICAYHAFYSYLCSMEVKENSVILQGATLSDIERMIERVIDDRMKAFYDSIRQRPPVLVRRKDAAAAIGVSLPTLDAYAKAGTLHARHVGGRVYYLEEELLSFRSFTAKPRPKFAGESFVNISPLPSSSHSQETP